MLENFFKLKENGTTVKTEIIAGITTFFAMAYIIFLWGQRGGKRCILRNLYLCICRNHFDGASGETSFCAGIRHGVKRVFRIHSYAADGQTGRH